MYGSKSIQYGDLEVIWLYKRLNGVQSGMYSRSVKSQRHSHLVNRKTFSIIILLLIFIQSFIISKYHSYLSVISYTLYLYLFET